MNKLRLLLCAMAICCNSMTGAKAAVQSAPTWNPDDTAPTFNDVATAAARARATHCETPSCKAIIVIHELTDIARFEAGDANGVASLYTGNRPQIAGHRLDRVLLRHPALYQPVCAAGTKLLSRFRIGPGVYEMWVPVQLMLSSVDMDLRDHGHCAEDFLAALPKNSANDQVRLNANSLCISGYENHHRPKAACDALIQGVNPGR